MTVEWFLTKANLNTLRPSGELLVGCKESKKIYYYEASGAAFTVDNDSVLVTGNGGNTRFVSLPYPGNAAVAYTPNFGSDLGTVTGISVYYRRVGSCIVLHGKFTLGSLGGGTDAWLTLPSGLNIDTGIYVSRANNLGLVNRLPVSSNFIFASTLMSLALTYDSSLGATKLRITGKMSGGVFEQNSAGSMMSGSEVITFVSTGIQIAEWL